MPAFEELRRGGVDARMIIAPHEPTLDHVGRIVEQAKAMKLRVARLDDATQGADVIVVDRVGVLGDIYALADVAFVGGAFHSAGLHSVLEPAAFGTPVLFGPRFANSRDAALLSQRGGGASVATTADLARRLRTWTTDASERRDAGDYARALVRSGVGAAERSFELVNRLLR
jgi:3-deoxy-D-manno-octulosonic-acid transferase